jgi:hypothetical protein
VKERMKLIFIFLIVILTLIVVSCTTTPKLNTDIVFTANVTNITFIARSWNVPDLYDVEFDNGRHLYLEHQEKAVQFVEGHVYTVSMERNGALLRARDQE